MSKENSKMTVKTIGATLLACLALGAVAVAPAQATLGIETFTTTSSDTQAGGHPDLSTSFTLEEPGVSESARNVIFNAPEGVFGNPNALLPCTSSDFALDQCATDSQAGIVTIYANYEGNPSEVLGTAPIYDLVPGPDQTALFALVVPVLNIPIQIPVAVRTGSDYGLRFTVSELTQTAPLAGANLTFWGFPAAGSHDAQRFAKGAPGEPAGCPGITDTSCIPGSRAAFPNNPLIDNPTICTGEPLVATLEVVTYQDPRHVSSAETTYPPTTGCEKEVFKPVLFANLTTNETDTATGLDLEVDVPQFLGETPAPAQLKTSIVTLPPGLTVNPDAADGQTACTEVDAHFGSEAPASCPDESKIGTFALNTPALAKPLVGSIFIGEPKPNDQYRLFMVADGLGVHAKLVGSVHPDPQTGQVTLIVDDLPQVPFDNVQFHLFASDRGLLATPTHCTFYEIKGQFIPWNATAADLVSTDFVGLDSGPEEKSCPPLKRPFEPRLAAGTTKPVAGEFSDFTLKLDRDDGDQYLGDLNFTMPPGFTGSLRGVTYCPEAAIAAAERNLGRSEVAAPSCPGSSQVGTSNVASGPGAHPFHAFGKMYLAGPLKGAPLSLAAITPALAGPYDYGNVVVRVALYIDPLTAQVRAVSEPMPQIIGGIPIRMRSIQVNIDKPNFAINPTNCSPLKVNSQGIGDQGTVTDFSSPFVAVNCATLPFKPKMKIKLLGGKGQTKRTKNPRLQFDLFTRHGDANIKSLSVTLSKAFQIDQRHLFNICSRSQLAAERCKGRQPMGSAWVKTPLLDEPLQGPTYAVSGFGKLPRLVFILDGQVTVMPQAESSSVRNGHLKTTVPVVPDVPVGHFRLTLLGGSKGYLINSRDLCRQAGVIEIDYASQSGKKRKQRVKPKVPCGKR